MLYCVVVMQVTDISQFSPTAKGRNHIPTIDFELLQNCLSPRSSLLNIWKPCTRAPN